MKSHVIDPMEFRYALNTSTYTHLINHILNNADVSLSFLRTPKIL